MAETKYCPYCLTLTDEAICPACRKSTNYTPAPWHLPVGASPDGHGRYRVGAALDWGDHAITYAGIDTASGQQVAIEEFFPNQLALRNGERVVPIPDQETDYVEARKVFLYENNMLYSARGIPSAVQVRNCFEENNTVYIVMEYLDGITLKQKVCKEGPIPAAELLPKFKVLSEDLAKLHAKGIIHRNINPDNIMWMPDGTLKLLGFISEEIDKTDDRILFYPFSPVEWYTGHDQGPWTDVYSLCATIYYCLTSERMPEAKERLEKDEFVPPRKLGITLTRRQEEALLRGLIVQPKKRTQDMEAFVKDFWLPPIIDVWPPILPWKRVWERMKKWLNVLLWYLLGFAAGCLLVQLFN